ncbi:MAG: hypothetical protein JW763_05745 [candidate division Zixibacteria bacterium]|nr:hypothetical protein [candidate division Zixibacteria bacterium]
MKQYRGRKPKPRHKPNFCLVINSQAADFSQDKIKKLILAISQTDTDYSVVDTDIPKEISFRIKRSLQRFPTGIIACGGDGTVNMVARHLIRRTSALGIYPLGKFNNIYRSLFGKPDLDKAIGHILSRQNKRIDQGLISGQVFLGSLGIGLMPEMHQMMENKRLPRFAIGWSRLAAQAAAAVPPREFSLKVDEFAFQISPLALNINLLPYSVGLPLTPASIADDGKCEIIFDVGRGQAVFSSYIRQIYKQKYLYSDDIRMYRGTKITLAPTAGQRLYIDGDIIDAPSNELNIEIFTKRIRVLCKTEE